MPSRACVGWVPVCAASSTASIQLQIEPVGENQVRFVQSEHFSGALATMLLRLIGPGTQQGFLAMNEALKVRAEAPTPAGA